MTDMPDTFLLRVCVRLVSTLSVLAPSWRRADWRDEWLGEVHFTASRSAARGYFTPAAQLRLLARCSAAPFHLFWLWKHEWGVDMLAQDIRYGVRLLMRRPAFSGAAVLMLALGIGATTAIFGAVRTVLLKPLAYSDPDRLVRMDGVDMRAGQESVGNLSVPDMVDFERLATSFAAMGAHNYGGYWTLTGAGEPERIPRLLVTSGYFRALGAQPHAGRLFRTDEDRPTPPDVVVISHGFWQRRFGGSEAVIGKPIILSGSVATIVGVLRPGFVHPDPAIESAPDVFALLDPDEKMSSRGGRYVRAIGKLKPGVTIDRASSEMRALAALLEERYPNSNTGRSLSIRPLSAAVNGDLRMPLILLQAATIAVLLIVCANLANLLLGAGTGRAGELTVRTALGAGRVRIVRQLLTESLVLAAVGGALGAALAWVVTTYLSTIAAPMLLPEQQIAVDAGVLLFALVISTAAGVLFGLVPALHISRDAPGAALREGRRHTDAPGTRRLRSMLIVAEIAISVTLVIGAFLVTRSFVQLTSVDPGFQAGEVTSFQLAVSGTQYPEGTQAAFYDRLYERLRRIPGVDAVGGVNILPLSGGYSCDGVQIDGRPVPKAQERCAEARSASPDYFRAMGIPLIRGRLFTAGDDARARRRVVVINEAMAREFFPGEDPLGRGVIYTSRGQSDSREVVGIIGNVHHFGLDQVPTPEFYTPQPQPPSYHGMTIVMRGHTDPASVMSAVRTEVRALAPDAPIYNVRTLEHLLDASVADARFRTLLLTSFAGLALLLAVVGTYSVISLLVTQRTQEMGIRLALGARPSDILRLVLGAGITPLALGTGIGLAGGMGATRALAGLLFNVTALDPLAFVSAAVVILLAGLLATWIPARRACRVDPVVALRTP